MFKYLSVIFTFMLFISFFIAFPAFCQDTTVAQLVDQYAKETGLQKENVVKGYLGKAISVSGTVADVGEEDTFDVVNDIRRHYYKVVTDVEKTPGHNTYRAILIYKSKEKVESVNRGQRISFVGNIIRIVDERLYLSVWLSKDELTIEERSLFK